METIRNYLETMFKNLPQTEKVLKAKSELLQMMEDKYTELINQGKSENEAIGTVIAEFGNLDELAGDLGIAEVLHEKKDNSEVQDQTAEGGKENGQGQENQSKNHHKAEKILKTAYWPAITFLYFFISFLTSKWGATWIIWLLAIPIYAVLMTLFSDKEPEKKSQK
jgi:amino acid permease